MVQTYQSEIHSLRQQLQKHEQREYDLTSLEAQQMLKQLNQPEVTSVPTEAGAHDDSEQVKEL
jgi:Tfp pilus assembly PilM family ATPase